MKIYTKTGDEGETSLFAGGRVPKNHLRLHTYGTVDELNSVIGLARAFDIDDALNEMLERVQQELFHVGSDLATPLEADVEWVVRVKDEQVSRLEHEIDQLSEELEPLKNFILPGGTQAAATLHQARTVCRRAERWLAALNEEENINPTALQYINRLSDWLFVMARAANHRAGVDDVIWKR
ncbi:MAG: cob(I)yrinic acid a,c-diamide adenosyltransferase [Chloroflexi bacterium]|nr:cob(I)yrinic acid a,c-diamide adenosyltransferase [Chloroflexota bacterium]